LKEIEWPSAPAGVTGVTQATIEKWHEEREGMTRTRDATKSIQKEQEPATTTTPSPPEALEKQGHDLLNRSSGPELPPQRKRKNDTVAEAAPKRRKRSYDDYYELMMYYAYQVEDRMRERGETEGTEADRMLTSLTLLRIPAGIEIALYQINRVRQLVDDDDKNLQRLLDMFQCCFKGLIEYGLS